MKVLALILSGCKSESSPEQNFPLLRTLKLQLNFQRAKQKQQKKDQMFLIYEQKWIRQWSTVSCCLTPWITLSGRRDASRVFPRPASNPPLPPSLNASRAAKTCSNPQIFNGGSRSFHRYQPCPAESWGREPEFTVLFFSIRKHAAAKSWSHVVETLLAQSARQTSNKTLSNDVEFSQIRLQTFLFFSHS